MCVCQLANVLAPKIAAAGARAEVSTENKRLERAVERRLVVLLPRAHGDGNAEGVETVLPHSAPKSGDAISFFSLFIRDRVRPGQGWPHRGPELVDAVFPSARLYAFINFVPVSDEK